MEHDVPIAALRVRDVLGNRGGAAVAVHAERAACGAATRAAGPRRAEQRSVAWNPEAREARAGRVADITVLWPATKKPAESLLTQSGSRFAPLEAYASRTTAPRGSQHLRCVAICPQRGPPQVGCCIDPTRRDILQRINELRAGSGGSA